MANTHDGRCPSHEQSTHSNADTTDRTDYDDRTASDLKRVSRNLGISFTAGGFVFEDGDMHALPTADGEQGGEST